MIDYEDLILARQESIEIAEDNYGWEDNSEIEEHYNPIVLRMIENAKREKYLKLTYITWKGERNYHGRY